MASHHNPRSDHHPPRNGLIKELEKLNRGRGFSATPKTSTANLVATMTMHDTRDQDMNIDFKPAVQESVRSSTSTLTHRSRPSASSSADLDVKASSNGDNKSRTLRSSRDMNKDVGKLKVLALDTPDLVNPVTEFATSFLQRLGLLKEVIQRDNGATKEDRQEILKVVDGIGQHFVGNARSLQNDFDKLQNERNQLQNQLEQTEARELATLADRDQVRSQIVKRQNSFERMRKGEGELKIKNMNLFRQVQDYEEQIQNLRRAMAKQKAIIPSADPFTSPTALSVASFMNKPSRYYESLGMIASSAGSSYGSNTALAESFGGGDLLSNNPTVPPIGASSPGEQTPTGPRSLRQKILPTGKTSGQHKTSVTQESILESLQNPKRDTEPPSPTWPTSSTVSAVISHPANADPTTIYAEKFSDIYKITERWSLLYASVPNTEVDSRLSETNPDLWAYMMRCTYPRNPHDAQAHIVALLQDSKSRYLLCMRLMVNYCVREIMVPDEFQLFDQESLKSLQGCKASLSERGLANNVRQSIIDQQTKVIERIIQDPKFSTFREARLKEHAAKLRNMLGPLLSRNAARSDAGKDLGTLAAKAWDNACALHTSYLTFQTVFPDTHTKFLSATMIARDKPDKDPHSLQLAQLRLKLVITPLTTMRNDRGTTIQAKELHKADVLTMA